MKKGGKRPGSGAKLKDPMDKRVKTSIQIPAWMLEKIDSMAAVAGKSRSTLIVDLLHKLFQGSRKRK